jgi:hypothetical protein
MDCPVRIRKRKKIKVDKYPYQDEPYRINFFKNPPGQNQGNFK